MRFANFVGNLTPRSRFEKRPDRVRFAESIGSGVYCVLGADGKGEQIFFVDAHRWSMN